MRKQTFLSLTVCFALVQALSASAQDELPGYVQARAWAPQNAEHRMFSYILKPEYFNNSAKFWYEYKTSEGVRWYVVDPEQSSRLPLFDLEQIASQISEITRDPFTAQHLPIRKLKIADDNRIFTFEIPTSTGRTFYFAYDYLTRKLETKDKGEPTPAIWGNISPDKKRVVYAKDLNLYYMSYADYEKLQANPADRSITEIALTSDGVENFGYGIPHFRLSTDTLLDHKRKQVRGSWSPDGRHFATMLSDERALNELWVIHSTAKPRPVLESYRYQMPGEPGAPDVHLYLFDLETNTRKEIQTKGYKNQTLELGYKPREKPTDPAVWLGDNSKFYLTRMSRDLKRVDICTFTIGDDSIKTVINEELNTYIETRPLAVTDDGKELIHWSERDGWAHLYL
ncbi:MAG: DPP IV N-terminal domain-containing protein, partial [Tannerella sp.]|nr:DPP IV N-terminal domain-containing protein [Tannerella sp.]